MSKERFEGEFDRLIEESGGPTRDPNRGDRPDPLTSHDEKALDRAWADVASEGEKSE